MAATGDFSLGVEEEYLVVDRRSRAPRLDGERLLAAARARLGERVQPELQVSQLEVGTAVCTTLDEVRRQLGWLRRGLAAALAEEGAAIAAAGTHPFASWRDGRITPRETYRRIEDDYRQLAREQLICGCHVHVAVADPELAVQVLNRVRPWLPALVALAANSPFWMGADTGYASFRTEVWRRWPTAGTPGTFADRAAYDRLVADLLATGSIDDPARLYFDVRPSSRYPTLEFRVTDVCLDAEEAVMVAGLVRALCRTCAGEARDGRPLPEVRTELIRAATWRAARHGLDADLLDLAARRAAPAAEVVGGLLAAVRPALDGAGEWDEVGALVRRTLARGTGAARQRRALAAAGRFEDVVDLVVAETAPEPLPG
ncbi:MAG: carboxylate-amine ligase [Acidimicrobiia bacterium]